MLSYLLLCLLPQEGHSYNIFELCFFYQTSSYRPLDHNRKYFLKYSTLNIAEDTVESLHCKPGPFDKQFCMANTAIFTSYITFQNNHNEIFHSRQMWIYELLICTFRQDENFNFVNWSFSSQTSPFALSASNF